MTPWNAESVLSLARDFMESRLLLTAAELECIHPVWILQKTLEEVVDALGSYQRGTEILLDALAAIGLLEKADDNYTCPETLLPALSSKDAGIHPAHDTPYRQCLAALVGSHQNRTIRKTGFHTGRLV